MNNRSALAFFLVMLAACAVASAMLSGPIERVGAQAVEAAVLETEARRPDEITRLIAERRQSVERESSGWPVAIPLLLISILLAAGYFSQRIGEMARQFRLTMKKRKPRQRTHRAPALQTVPVMQYQQPWLAPPAEAEPVAPVDEEPW